MRILHTSDLHIGKSLYDFSLLDEQRKMLDFILSLIEIECIDAVLISGDVYDRPVPSAEAVRLYDYFLSRAVGEKKTPVIAIAGNHDSASRLQFGSKLYAGSHYYVFGSATPFQEPVILRDEFGEVRFHPVPWLHPSEIRAMFPEKQIKTFDDAYRVFLSEYMRRTDPGSRNVAVAHGFFAGISSHSEKEILVSDSEINIGGMDIADSAYFSAFDYTALGHLHAPQRAGSDKIRYSGSPLKYSLSEERQCKSCAIIELSQKPDVEIKLVPIPAERDVRTVSGSFDELMEPSFHTNKQFSDFVFANIADSGVLYPMEKLRTLFPNLLGLRFITPEESFSTPAPSVSTSASMSVVDLFRRFYKDSKNVEMPQDRLDFLLEILEKSEVERQ